MSERTRTWLPHQASNGKATTRVTVVCQARYDDDGPFEFGATYEDGSLDRVINSLLAIRDMIPEEYRAVATAEVNSEGGYEGCHYATIEVEYDRPATPEEVAECERERDVEASARRQQELAMLSALQAKYGS